MENELYDIIAQASEKAAEIGRCAWVYRYGEVFGFRFGPLQRRELEDPYVDTALVCVLGPDGELVALNLFG